MNGHGLSPYFVAENEAPKVACRSQIGRTPKGERALLGRPEEQQSCKDYDYAHQARSQDKANIVARSAGTSVGSGFFCSFFGLVFGHGRSVPLLVNGFANYEFHKLAAPTKTASPRQPNLIRHSIRADQRRPDFEKIATCLSLRQMELFDIHG
jgi:hypothetical protein